MKREGYAVVFALTLFCARLFGQTVASSLEGMVADPANAVVADATVTLTSAETGAVRTGTSDSTKIRMFFLLPARSVARICAIALDGPSLTC